MYWLQRPHNKAAFLHAKPNAVICIRLGVEAFNASFVPDSADFSVKDEAGALELVLCMCRFRQAEVIKLRIKQAPSTLCDSELCGPIP